jgi:hypothetical protein
MGTTRSLTALAGQGTGSTPQNQQATIVNGICTWLHGHGGA